MIAQIILLGILTLSLGLQIGNHGKPREGNYNAWSSIVSYAIIMTLLYYSGFFKF